MESWITKHAGKICVFFATLFAIEAGIWCHQMPRQFKSSIIPRIDMYLANYTPIEDNISQLNKRVDFLMNMEMYEVIGADNERW